MAFTFELADGRFGIALAAAVSALMGDYHQNGVVDAADYTVYRNTIGRSGPGFAADGNGNNLINLGDYDVWRAHFGQSAGSRLGTSANAAVPEPATAVILLMGVFAIFSRRRSTVP